MSSSYQTKAIVIKESKLGEGDKILTLYTPEFGKLKAVAKGACRPGSKFGANVEPLTYSLVMLAKGRNLDILTQSQTIDAFSALKNDLWRMACGLYVLELIDSSTVESSENCPLFDLLLDTLHRLCQGEDSGIVLRYFELRLADYLGYRPQLYQCVICKSALRPVANFFSPSQGGTLCPRCSHKESEPHPLSVAALKVLRLWQDCDYATARRVKLKSDLSHELEQVLQGYLRCILQRELKSMAWLEELRKTSLLDNSRGRN